MNVYDCEFEFKNLAFLSDAQAEKLSNVMVAEGDVLLNITGASVARCCQVPVEALPARVNQHVSIIRPIQKIVQPEFLAYLLASKACKNRLLETGEKAGATRQAITKAQLQSFLVSFPESLSEQQRIVAILDEAFAGLATATANAEKNLENARELFESYLNSAFASEGDGRAQRTLSDVCNGMTVGHVGPMATRYKPNGVPFLRSQNIRPFEVDLNEVVFIDEEFHRSLAKSALRPGDVAIVRTGYPGTAAVIPETLVNANCADLVIIRQGEDIIPEYVAAFFNSAYGKRLVSGAAVGAAQKHFNVTSAKAVKISLPAKGEQKRLVSGINAMRDECRILESVYQRKSAHLRILRQSILQKAFSGELTAPPTQAIKEAAE